MEKITMYGRKGYYEFKYRGFDFELVDNVGTDRYVCWMWGVI